MKDLSWLKHELIAHRGLHTKDKVVPENSMLAFRNALDHDYAIECDVNILGDETVVIFHDFDLKRMCDDDRILEHLSYDDIKDLKLFNTDQHIPKLQELLDLVQGKKPLLIELKPHGSVDHLVYHTMEIMKNYEGPYALFSFHPMAVSALKKYYPHVIRGQISEYFINNQFMNKLSKFLMKRMVFNRFTKPDFISYGIKDLPNKYLDKAKKKGITVISYAAQSQEDFDLVKSHYDNVVFEYFHPKK